MSKFRLRKGEERRKRREGGKVSNLPWEMVEDKVPLFWYHLVLF